MIINLNHFSISIIFLFQSCPNSKLLAFAYVSQSGTFLNSVFNLIKIFRAHIENGLAEVQPGGRIGLWAWEAVQYGGHEGCSEWGKYLESRSNGGGHFEAMVFLGGKKD